MHKYRASPKNDNSHILLWKMENTLIGHFDINIVEYFFSKIDCIKKKKTIKPMKAKGSKMSTTRHNYEEQG